MMIEETAVVTRAAEGVAWVQTRRKTACGGCSLNKGCGVSVLEKMLGDRNTTLQVIDPLSVRPGDEVVIGIRESALVRGSVAIYIVPLLAMMLFAILGSAVVAPLYDGLSAEGSSILGGGVGLVVGFGWVSVFSRRIKRDLRYQPVILRKTGYDSVPERYIPITRI